MNKPVVVVGDGWAALGAVSLLLQEKGAKTKIKWITGSGARITPPLPSLGVGQGLRGGEVWKEIASGFGIECGESQTGSYLREFRNKSFREPLWTKSPTPETRLDTVRETLWAPEVSLVPLFETRFPVTLNELEEQIRAKLIGEEAEENYPGLERIEGVPVSGFKVKDGQVQGVILGSGEEIEAERVIYADRWATIPGLQGLPKGLPFLRKRDPMSILQTIMTHEVPMGTGLMEGFYGILHKEAGENVDKHVWGHFSSDGRRSYWTLCVHGEEVEDNHAIGRKLRRMKNALEKMFTGESWLPAGKSEFMANVRDEQVRFEESVLFAEGEMPLEAIRLPKLDGLVFMTDGYGPSCAFHQVGHEFGLLARLDANAQTESMNSVSTGAAEGESSAPESVSGGHEVIYQ